ncbi:unnamed protein product [Prunus armeniaca]|uniref:Uncharacterized protein n=1 Tax=Prunus armeniaca TaxID=36596 RepID=A0A6J5TBR3_PRUAR|nr:hypothetical protein GBA52_026468 [Prunus armeniaca]CAB4261373.1 unnamed protein product [Prunus armeniaca]
MVTVHKLRLTQTYELPCCQIMSSFQNCVALNDQHHPKNPYFTVMTHNPKQEPWWRLARRKFALKTPKLEKWRKNLG